MIMTKQQRINGWFLSKWYQDLKNLASIYKKKSAEFFMLCIFQWFLNEIIFCMKIWSRNLRFLKYRLSICVCFPWRRGNVASGDISASVCGVARWPSHHIKFDNRPRQNSRSWLIKHDNQKQMNSGPGINQNGHVGLHTDCQKPHSIGYAPKKPEE